MAVNQVAASITEAYGSQQTEVVNSGEHVSMPLSAKCRRTSQRSAPFNLIGANGFAGQDHCSRVCGAKHRRAGGAPLTVILNGKRILGTVGRVTRTDRLARCRRPRNGEQPHTQGSGAIRPASVARPERSRAAGRDRPTPRARTDPVIPR